MREFDQQLLRLKAVLGMTSDQEVAAALGMTKAAFSDRKKRGAFPEEKVLALATLRQDLQIDPQYVLSGQRSTSNVASTQHLPPDEQLLLDSYRGLSAAKKKQLLTSLLTGDVAKKPPKSDGGVSVRGSGNRTAGRDFHE
ncbi:helix-turn-helix domain-containing protein [Pseudomonas anguilliseptica]|uniref:Bacteriophage CI repressor helix-turn-helix domain-containing protein n=1 Tax=Pseudomonas anguilliseptica TaxID=53406 RepID=A0A1H5B3Q6_PSEAG|nr:helix-turn-helix domain-containing protein [Pseudomonas anguilliseptica]SED49016.1 Bacteriophage CI repressor helix-turn-helix domain-containing protein [Pseudomonas anguilliseptica]